MIINNMNLESESDNDDDQLNTVDFDADADYVPDEDVSNQTDQESFCNTYDCKQHELNKYTESESDIDDNLQKTVDFDADSDYVPDEDVSNQTDQGSFRSTMMVNDMNLVKNTESASDIDDAQQNTVDFDVDTDHVPDVDVRNQTDQGSFRNTVDSRYLKLQGTL